MKEKALKSNISTDVSNSNLTEESGDEGVRSPSQVISLCILVIPCRMTHPVLEVHQPQTIPPAVQPQLTGLEKVDVAKRSLIHQKI